MIKIGNIASFLDGFVSREKQNQVSLTFSKDELHDLIALLEKQLIIANVNPRKAKNLLKIICYQIGDINLSFTEDAAAFDRK